MTNDIRKRRQSGESATSSQPTESTTSTQTAASPDPCAKVDKSGLYDMQQVKRLLDDQIIAFMEDQGYMEAVLVSNVKIIFGSIAVIAAVYSHFNPWTFPENYRLVLTCVILYTICMSIVNITSYFLEANAIFIAKLAPKKRQVSKTNLVPRIWVVTNLNTKGSSQYKIDLRTTPRQKDCVSVSHPYEKYFTEHGRFLSDRFRTDMIQALSKVNTGSKKSD